MQGAPLAAARHSIWESSRCVSRILCIQLWLIHSPATTLKQWSGTGSALVGIHCVVCALYSVKVRFAIAHTVP